MDRNAEIRIASLASHGPFQDLMNYLKNTRLNEKFSDLRSATEPDVVLRKHAEYRGFEEALTAITAVVDNYARNYKVKEDDER